MKEERLAIPNARRRRYGSYLALRRDKHETYP